MKIFVYYKKLVYLDLRLCNLLLLEDTKKNANEWSCSEAPGTTVLGMSLVGKSHPQPQKISTLCYTGSLASYSYLLSFLATTL